jgi:hypothetical protein
VTARVRCKCSKSVTLNTATYSPPKTIGDSLGITVACLSVNVIPWALWYADPWASSKGNCFLKYRTGDPPIQSSSCKCGAYCVVHITFAIELFLHSSLHLRSFMEVLLDHLEATPCCDPSTENFRCLFVDDFRILTWEHQNSERVRNHFKLDRTFILVSNCHFLTHSESNMTLGSYFEWAGAVAVEINLPGWQKRELFNK